MTSKPSPAKVSHDVTTRSRWRGVGLSIGLGFALVLVLHISIAVLGHVGLTRAADDADRYEELRQQAVQFVANEAAAVELQRDVLLFTFTGHASVAQRAQATEQELSQQLRLLHDGGVSEAQGETLRAMLHVLSDYSEHFARVEADRGLRSELLEQSLLPLGRGFLQQLLEIESEARSQGDTLSVENAQGCVRELLMSQACANEYLQRPGAVPVREFRSRIKVLEQRLAELSSRAPDHRSELGVIRESLPDYEGTFLGIVQATRSYLHLVNVVLAGAAYEFETLSRQFREQGMAEIAAHRTSMAQQQSRFQFWSNTASLFTIVLGLIAGARIGRSIAVPLRSMSKTLTCLASSEEAVIPGVDRRDEIGDMARAAEVFKGRNHETQKLLKQSQEFSRRHEEMNEELKRTIATLKDRNEDLDSYAYIASHDLKAPLRAISHLLRWIEEDVDNKLSADGERHLVTMRGRIQRLESLLNGLLEFSRVGREHYPAESIAVRSLVASVVDLNDIPEGLEVEIHGDEITIESYRIPLEQVVLNLLGNAVKHHDRSRGRIDVWIAPADKGVRLTVEDDGPGVPEEFRERVFKIFQTLRPRDEKECSGIGLSIVEKTVHAFEGKIWVEHNSPRGARFVVEWPALPPGSAIDREPLTELLAVQPAEEVLSLN